MNQYKAWKLYYLLSMAIILVALPIAVILLFKKEQHTKEPHTVSLLLPRTENFKKFPQLYPELDKTVPPERSYTEISFTGNKQDDALKLLRARLRIKEILLRNDTTSGVHFLFTRDADFGSFLNAIDVLNMEGAKRFLILGDDLWMYNISTDAQMISVR